MRAEDPTLWNDAAGSAEADARAPGARRRHPRRSGRSSAVARRQYRTDRARRGRGRRAASSPRPRRRSARSPARSARRQIETMLSGEADSNDTYLEVHAGAGGTESQDWANMLLRMYTRWAERRKFKVEVLEMHDGEEAGIKSATLLIKGHNAYGWLKTESGVHRLVRISPYDSQCAPPHLVRQRLGLSGGRRFDRDRRQRIRCAHRHLPLVGLGRPARQHHRFGGAHHASGDRHRGRLPGRALAAQEQGQGLGDAALAALRGRTEEARGRGQRRPKPPRPTSAGATRSAPTCCSPTRWSRTCAPASKARARRTCWTAISTSSWKRRCRSASTATMPRRSPISTDAVGLRGRRGFSRPAAGWPHGRAPG